MSAVLEREQGGFAACSSNNNNNNTGFGLSKDENFQSQTSEVISKAAPDKNCTSRDAKERMGDSSLPVPSPCKFATASQRSSLGRMKVQKRRSLQAAVIEKKAGSDCDVIALEKQPPHCSRIGETITPKFAWPGSCSG